MKLELIKRGALSDGSVETMYRSNIENSTIQSIDQLENLFRRILEEKCDFTAQTARSGEREAYKINVLYDTKERCYLLHLIERKKCLHRLLVEIEAETSIG